MNNVTFLKISTLQLSVYFKTHLTIAILDGGGEVVRLRKGSMVKCNQIKEQYDVQSKKGSI